MIYGPGGTLCEEWLENEEHARDLLSDSWIAGAFTGYENTCRIMGGHCIRNKVQSMNQIYVRARAYCRMHPDQKIADAALNTWINMNKDPNPL